MRSCDDHSSFQIRSSIYETFHTVYHFTFIIDSLQITVVGIKVAGAIASQIVIVNLLLNKDFNDLGNGHQ